uniref:kinetochore-associated protein DSN1 homolog isoform X2 n=1 Tax=Myxine glutinosa TaxID=7769 RepID=UPI00358F967E
MKNKREEEEQSEEKMVAKKKKSKSPQQIQHMECQHAPVSQDVNNETSKGERSRRRSSFICGRVRKSLPPLIQNSSEFRHMIKQDIPENERLKKLLEIIMEHHLRRIQACLANTTEFDFAAFQSEAMQIMVKNLATMDEEGLLVSSVEQKESLKEDILANVNPDDEGSVKMKADILNLMRVSSAWDDLLRKQKQRSLPEVSPAAPDPGRVEPEPSSSSGGGDLASVLANKPDYEAMLTSLHNLPDCTELTIDRLQSCQSKLSQVTAKARQYLHVTTGSLRHAALHTVDGNWNGLLQSPSDAPSRFFTTLKE